jgi:hypothetical protein
VSETPDEGRAGTGDAEPRPLLRVVKGDPTPDEVAALVAVVSALASTGGEQTKPRRRPEWSAHHRKVRGAHRHGGDAWRMSAR